MENAKTNVVNGIDYNKILSSLREAARDELRLVRFSSLRSNLYSLTSELNSANDHKAKIAKKIACIDYDLGKIDPADPRATDLTDNLNESLKLSNDRSADLDRDIKILTNEIAEVNANIAKVTTGEFKVSCDAMNIIVERMIVDHSKCVVAKLA
jgi:chromosome segregation ATPase